MVLTIITIITTKLLLAEILVGAYNSNRWTRKPTEYYSVNSKKDLQATGTTHDNEKMQWYWIGTKFTYVVKNDYC